MISGGFVIPSVQNNSLNDSRQHSLESTQILFKRPQLEVDYSHHISLCLKIQFSIVRYPYITVLYYTVILVDAKFPAIMVNRKFLFILSASLINLSNKRNILNTESRNLLSHRKVACNFQELYDSPELQPKLLYISHVVSNFHDTEILIQAGFGPDGSTKKNWTD